MDVVSQFCKDYRLDINIKKSKVMVVLGENGDGENMKLSGNGVGRVSRYKYLGVWIDEKLSWKYQCDQVVMKVKSKIQNWSRIFRNNNINVENRVRIWKTVIRPVMEYGGAIWWTTKVEERRLESIQLGVGKQILGVARTTPDSVIRGDLGLESLKSRRDAMKLKFLAQIYLAEEDRFVRDLLDMKYKFRGARRSWCVMMDKLVSFYQLENDLEELEQGKLTRVDWEKVVDKKVKEIELSSWKSEVVLGKKLDMYRLAKTDWGLEDWMRGEWDDEKRVRFKWRSGVHELEVEMGRRSGKDREERVCKVCKNGVEDVKHVLVDCERYENIRKEFWDVLESQCRRWSCVKEFESLLDMDEGDLVARILGKKDNNRLVDEIFQELALQLVNKIHISRVHFLYGERGGIVPNLNPNFNPNPNPINIPNPEPIHNPEPPIPTNPEPIPNPEYIPNIDPSDRCLVGETCGAKGQCPNANISS